jgi:hypothetical protein
MRSFPVVGAAGWQSVSGTGAHAKSVVLVVLLAVVVVTVVVVVVLV